MLRIASGADSAPTILLADALRSAAADLFTATDRNVADLTIRPRANVAGPREMTRDAWYDLVWTRPALRVVDDIDGPELIVEHTEIEPAGHLPAPPRIPAEDRIAAAPPVTLDHISDGTVRMYGGADEVRRILISRRDIAIRDDRSADAYDWSAYADQVAAHVRTLTAPKLTAGQRAQVAAVRLLEAHRRVHAERASLAAHLANAERAGDTAAVARIRQALDLIDPSHVPA